MRERPIMFSSPMVRAILSGGKTQTRRVIRHQPNPIKCGEGYGSYLRIDRRFIEDRCPHGVPGDQLWVKETFFFDNYMDENHSPVSEGPFYLADFPGGNDELKWTPSIFMPRCFSRISLLITDVRVQRIQDISERDAFAEGIEPGEHHEDSDIGPIDHFMGLWDSINAKRGFNWDSNPWTWAITFKKL